MMRLPLDRAQGDSSRSCPAACRNDCFGIAIQRRGQASRVAPPPIAIFPPRLSQSPAHLPVEFSVGLSLEGATSAGPQIGPEHTLWRTEAQTRRAGLSTTTEAEVLDRRWTRLRPRWW